MPTATQSHWQRTVEVVLAAAPPDGWPRDPATGAEVKFTSPGVVHLPERNGPFIVKVVSGAVNIEASFSSRQSVIDATANWEEWPHGAVVGPFPSDVLETAEALRITATADAVVEIMGIRS